MIMTPEQAANIATARAAHAEAQRLTDVSFRALLAARDEYDTRCQAETNTRKELGILTEPAASTEAATRDPAVDNLVSGLSLQLHGFSLGAGLTADKVKVSP